MSIVVLLFLLIIVVLLLYNIYRSNRPGASNAYNVGALSHQMTTTMESLSDMCESIVTMESTLPQKVLHTIQGSINPRRGKVAELVTLLKLTSEYNRIIPLGQPVDMIGISEDSIDFIEVKVNNGRLTSTEKHIKELVDARKVRFIIVRPSIELNTEEDVDGG